MVSSIIPSTAVLALTLNLLMIAVSSAALANNVLAVGLKILVNGLLELFTKPVLRLQLISLLALSTIIICRPTEALARNFIRLS